MRRAALADSISKGSARSAAPLFDTTVTRTGREEHVLRLEAEKPSRDDVDTETTAATALEALGAPVDSFLLDALREEKAVRAFALKKGFLPGTEPCYFTFELARFLRPHLPELLRLDLLFAPSVLYALRFVRVSQAPDMKRLRRRIARAFASKSRAVALLRLESIYDQARATRPKQEPADSWLDAYVRRLGFQSGSAFLRRLRLLRAAAREAAGVSKRGAKTASRRRARSGD